MRLRVLATLWLLVLAGCGQNQAPLPAPEPSGQAAGAGQVIGATLHRVRARQRGRGGGGEPTLGFAERGLTGQWRGFDVEVCRAIAAAVLGDGRAVSFTA